MFCSVYLQTRSLFWCDLAGINLFERLRHTVGRETNIFCNLQRLMNVEQFGHVSNRKISKN